MNINKIGSSILENTACLNLVGELHVLMTGLHKITDDKLIKFINWMIRLGVFKSEILHIENG
ncbi:hypothetical protein ID853_03765 [Xenorhabdus sp. Vera]|nr:hypothetical protein [Xenorhabdus sp. Vera]